MARNFTYTFEDENGETKEYEVTYSISKGSGGSYLQPPEPPEIEIHSIQCGGMEVAHIEDRLLYDIEDKIWSDSDNDEDFYDGFDDLD
jgi:hypothetical protein